MVDPNNRFTGQPRTVHQAVAQAHVRIQAIAREMLDLQDPAKLAALRSEQADLRSVVSHGEAWLKWSPDDAAP